jgi:DNA-binding NtrC family response regulator
LNKQKRILVVDDDDQILTVWRGALLKYAERWCVETARCGHEGLEALQRTSFDLVVTDLRMPGITGRDLTEAVRRMVGNVPVIWITAFPQSDIQANAEALGVHSLLYKPLSITQMRQAVLNVLGNEN